MIGSDRGGAAETVLVADLVGKRFAEVRDPGFAGFTERHHCDLLKGVALQPTDDIDAVVKRFIGRHIALVSPSGLPGRILLRRATDLVAKGRRVHLYWPEEAAVEVLDRHRITSIRNVQAISFLHRAQDQTRHGYRRGVEMANQGWDLAVGPHSFARKVYRFGRSVAQRVFNRAVHSAGKAKRIASAQTQMQLVVLRFRDESGKWKHRIGEGNSAEVATRRLREAAASLIGTEKIRAGGVPTRREPIRGAGAYVRLDYWASLKAGGSYGHTCFLAKAAADVSQGFRCIFANRYELLDKLGVPQHVIPHALSSENTANLVTSGYELNPTVASLLDEQKPAYVYERSVVGSWAAASWCARAGVPYIVEYNGSELAIARSFGNPYQHESTLEAIENFNFSVATVINVISEPVAQSLIERGIPRAKILVNPNAVDPETYKPMEAGLRAETRKSFGLDPDHVVVGFSGTYGGWHGIEVLAAAIPRICAAHPRARFLLIGDGNLKHLVREAITANNLAGRVDDIGLVPQLEGARALAACDILIAPHAQNIDGRTFFGSPTKLFEYMAVGAAIVSSDLAQLGEVMSPALRPGDVGSAAPHGIGERRGVLIKPGSTDELVSSVVALIDKPELRAALGRNARAAAIANYTWDIHVENIWRHLAGLPLKGYSTDQASKDVAANGAVASPQQA